MCYLLHNQYHGVKNIIFRVQTQPPLESPVHSRQGLKKSPNKAGKIVLRFVSVWDDISTSLFFG